MVSERIANPSNRNVMQVRVLLSALSQRDRAVKVPVLKTGCQQWLVGSNPTVGVKPSVFCGMAVKARYLRMQ